MNTSSLSGHNRNHSHHTFIQKELGTTDREFPPLRLVFIGCSLKSIGLGNQALFTATRVRLSETRQELEPVLLLQT